MGGMHGMGPIQYESNEPVFHEPWEARVFALLARIISDRLESVERTV
jgi:nitrile hydratase